MFRPLQEKSPWRDRRGGELIAAYQAYLDRGFPTAAFEGQPEPETLQCRDETDQIRWMGLLLKCQAALGAGEAETPIDPPIRCTSNRSYVVTYAEAGARMMALLQSYGLALKNLWRLKDAIAACRYRDELNQIDVTEGWP